MKKHVIDLFIYRWRYILGYGSLALFLIIAIVIASIYSPGGLSPAEMSSVAPIESISSASLAVPDLPLKLLQTAIFSVIGVSIFSIKLPSIILAVLSSVAIFYLLRRWFKPNITILSMLIMITTGQFLFIAQNATSAILYVFYSSLILLFTSLIVQGAKYQRVWKAALGVSMALSLYTPYFIYIIVGLAAVALLHPHTRYQLLRKSQRLNWVIGILSFLVVLAPGIFLCLQNPELGKWLLGYANISSLNVVENLKTLLYTYFWISPIVTNGQIVPIMDYAVLAMTILGFIVLFRHRYTARTYMIAAWIILTLPILIIEPNLTAIVTVPLIILLAIGIEALLYEWYKLFPKNPYARGTGLVLIVGLIGVMVLSGIDQFTNSYHFMPKAAQEYQTDISLVKKQLSKTPVRTLLLVSDDELPLYRALVRYNYKSLDLVATTSTKNNDIGNVIATRSARHEAASRGWALQGIITSGKHHDGDRLYLYKATTDAV